MTEQEEGERDRSGKPVRIYLADWCGFCRAARSLLMERKIPFDEVDVDGDDATRTWLRKATGRTTIPQIFIGGKSIGGFSELRALDAKGELAELVANASTP
ncbi:MAG: glutaredoxin [Deltaproteobacteria bacterium]|nr:glutaredoxin [Deltaproteobacteria bacterium]